ncbi:hypothetical protein [Vallitalea okinawensis]|uniref:hypothetical protein n=1 Tax=Vallitalea okinawensis TaxID=2078660 RepID=UPI000CFCD70F|nr:hypothetical protein [Vallitalea okinawensis]
MNYIKEAENHLYHYRALTLSIDNMQRERNKLILENGPHDISSIELNPMKVKGGKQQDEAINTLFKIQQLTKSIKDTKERLSDIDKVLVNMNTIEADILKKWYIQKDDKNEIARTNDSYSSIIQKIRD